MEDPFVAEARAFHAPLYREMLRRLGAYGNGPLVGHDWFRESLINLIEAGYSLTEVSGMVGVSRERVRQWFKAMGLRRSIGGPSRRRVWSSAVNRFVPQSRQRRQRRWTGGTGWWKWKCAQRWRQVRTLRDLYERLGRPPTSREMYLAGLARISIKKHWRFPWDEHPYKEAVARLHRTAKVPQRPTGNPGHINNSAG